MDILTAVKSKGLQMKRVATTNGGEWAGPCPVCAGNDRFRVWPQKEKGGGFYCRQCDKAGDLIEFYKWADKMSYGQACEAAGMDAKKYDDRYAKPTLPKSDRQAFVPRDYADPAEVWREHAEKFVAACHAELMNNAAALARLEQSRGITTATVERFKLGMNLDQAFYRPRVSWGLPEEIKENGKPKKLWIPRGLVIPFYDDGGKEFHITISLGCAGPRRICAVPPTPAITLCPGHRRPSCGAAIGAERMWWSSPILILLWWRKRPASWRGCCRWAPLPQNRMRPAMTICRGRM